MPAPQSAIETKYRYLLSNDQKFPFTFYDKEDTPFKAKPDLILTNTDGRTVYVELKAHHLNTVTTTRTSENALRRQCNYRGLPIAGNHNDLSFRLWQAGHHKDCLNFGWNHSGRKHQIVNNTLKQHQLDYLVVMPTNSKLINGTPFKIHYQTKYNLKVITQKEFDDLLACDHLKKL